MGGLRAPPGSLLFPVRPRPAFSRFFPFVPAFRGLLSCVGARALDTIETSATFRGARPDFSGFFSPRPPRLFRLVRVFVSGSGVGPARPASLPPLRSPGRALPVLSRGRAPLLVARVRASAGPTRREEEVTGYRRKKFRKNSLQMLTNARKCGIIINRGDVGAPTLSLNSIQSRGQKGFI